VAVKVFQDEGGLDRDAFQIGEHPGGVAGVVKCLRALGQLINCAIAVAAGREGATVEVGDHRVSSAANQAGGDGPLECGEAQGGTGNADQAHGARLFDCLNHHDGRGGVDKDFQAVEDFVHIRLTSQDLLSYNNVFGTPGISL
jgi:hypothetical protein